MKTDRAKRIANINFYKIPHYIDVYQVMSIDMQKLEAYGLDFKTAFRSLLLYFYWSLYERFTYDANFKMGSKMIFFYGNFWIRQDQQRTYKNFVSYFDYADSICGIEIQKKLNILKLIKYSAYMLIWMVQMIKRRIPLKVALLTLPYLQSCKLLTEYCVNIPIEKYKLLVVYSELTPDENYMVQLFKHHNLITATMQHGTFVAKCEDVTNALQGITLRKSNTDYFLAWNRFTYDQAIKEGMSGGKIQILGIPKYIGYKVPENPICSHRNVFGVLLNGYTKEFDKQNLGLLKMAQKIAILTETKYVVRYHPDMQGTEYNYLLGEDCLGIDNNKTAIIEYAQSVDFTIMTCSSVFIELIFLRHPTYRLSGYKEDIYSSIPYNTFSTENDFINLKRSNFFADKQLFEYLCNTDGVYEQYDKFFKTLLACGRIEG